MHFQGHFVVAPPDLGLGRVSADAQHLVQVRGLEELVAALEQTHADRSLLSPDACLISRRSALCFPVQKLKKPSPLSVCLATSIWRAGVLRALVRTATCLRSKRKRPPIGSLDPIRQPMKRGLIVTDFYFKLFKIIVFLFYLFNYLLLDTVYLYLFYFKPNPDSILNFKITLL